MASRCGHGRPQATARTGARSTSRRCLKVRGGGLDGAGAAQGIVRRGPGTIQALNLHPKSSRPGEWLPTDLRGCGGTGCGEVGACGAVCELFHTCDSGWLVLQVSCPPSFLRDYPWWLGPSWGRWPSFCWRPSPCWLSSSRGESLPAMTQHHTLQSSVPSPDGPEVPCRSAHECPPPPPSPRPWARLLRATDPWQDLGLRGQTGEEVGEGV